MSEMYPTEIVLKHSINGGCAVNRNNQYVRFDTTDCVILKLTIQGSQYPVDEVGTAVKEICQKALECFGQCF